MRSAYLNAPSRELICLWCNTQLQDLGISHRQWSITTSAGLTSVVELGHALEPEPAIVVVPGTNMNTAASLPFLAELASRRRIIALDIPGQPGLSASQRPSRERMTWYGRWLGETLEQTVPDRAVLLGHSLGGAIALACSSQRIAGRVLVAPAGLVRLAVPPRLLTATLRWLAAPSYTSTGRLLQLMTSPTRVATPDLVEWMTLVARYCRTTLAPAPLSPQLLAGCRSVPTLVATGSHDIFLPPQRLRRAVSEHLGTELRVIADCGHLALDDHPTRVADLVDELAASI